MIEYERDYLRCAAAGFGPTDFIFCSGPESIREPYTSGMVGSFAEYQAVDIAAGISRLPDTLLAREGLHESVWRWQQEDRHIEISVDGDNITEDGFWMASPLEANCTFSDLITFWVGLAESYPRIYVHAPSCRMYTPCSFLEEVGVEALWPAFRSDDPAVRSEAIKDFEHYLSLCRQPREWQRYWLDKTPHMKASLFDLAPPVVPIKCKDFWRGSNWSSLMDQFDESAHGKQLTYFAYPTNEWVKRQYQSGFMVWVSESQEQLGREIADSLGVLV